MGQKFKVDLFAELIRKITRTQITPQNPKKNVYRAFLVIGVLARGRNVVGSDSVDIVGFRSLSTMGFNVQCLTLKQYQFLFMLEVSCDVYIVQAQCFSFGWYYGRDGYSEGIEF